MDITCPACNAPLSGQYVERSGRVFLQIGGVLLERGTCANCGKKLYFTPSDEPLQDMLARQRSRWERIEAQIEAAKEATRREVEQRRGMTG